MRRRCDRPGGAGRSAAPRSGACHWSPARLADRYEDRLAVSRFSAQAGQARLTVVPRTSWVADHLNHAINNCCTPCRFRACRSARSLVWAQATRFTIRCWPKACPASNPPGEAALQRRRNLGVGPEVAGQRRRLQPIWRRSSRRAPVVADPHRGFDLPDAHERPKAAPITMDQWALLQFSRTLVLRPLSSEKSQLGSIGPRPGGSIALLIVL